MRVQHFADKTLIVNWLYGRWKIFKPRFRAVVHKTQKLLEQMDMRHMSDFQHNYRDWNGEADHLTHRTRAEGPTRKGFSGRG